MALILYGKGSGHQLQSVVVFHTTTNPLKPAGYSTNVLSCDITYLDLASDPTG